MASKSSVRAQVALARANAKKAGKKGASASKSDLKTNAKSPGKSAPGSGELPKIIGFISVGVILIVVLALVLISTTRSNSSNTKNPHPLGGSLSPTLYSEVTNIPAKFYNEVGISGKNVSPPTKITGPLLKNNSLPEVLYIGAEFCPYCAAERWVLLAALSRFGTFSNLETWYSSSSDAYPNTPTFSFVHASYSSKYISFVPIENEDQNHNLLQPVTPQENTLWQKYSPNNQQGYPFIDIGNRYTLAVQYNPSLLSGLTQAQVAKELNNPSTQISQAILTAANYTTAAICKITNNAPKDVCESPGVVSASKIVS